MAPNKQLRTFISYSRVNKQFAIRLASELKAGGFSIWLDQFDIPTGKRWDDEIEKALRECEIFLIIMTPASTASENAKDEIGYAIDHGKRIMPVLLEDCEIPLRLRRLQYVDFTRKNFDDGISSAKELLSRLVNEESTPTPTRIFAVKEPQGASSIKSKERATQPSKIKPSRTLDIRQEIPVITTKKQPSAKSIVGIIGIVVVVVLVFLAGKFSGVQPPSTPTPSTTSTQTQEIKPSETPASTVTAIISETPDLASQGFTEDFNYGNIGELWKNWKKNVVVGNDNDFKFDINTENLIVQIRPRDKMLSRVLLLRNDFNDADVKLEATFINTGNNSNGVILICRYSDKGWYEFRISNSKNYSIDAFKPNGDILGNLASGSLSEIKSGNVETDFTATCKGNELSLAVMGIEITTTLAKYDFTEGTVGIGFSAPIGLPVDVEFKSVKTSKP